MTPIDKMKVYIVDIDSEKASIVSRFFADENVNVICSDLSCAVDKYDIDCIVSPANSFGIMDGGFDEAITMLYGDDLQKRIRERIAKEYFGEQPVGTSMLAYTGSYPGFIIHTPSMRTPKVITDRDTIYHCTRSALICAAKNDINSIILPLFGGGCGNVPAHIIGQTMSAAYSQLLCPEYHESWETVRQLPINYSVKYS